MSDGPCERRDGRNGNAPAFTTCEPTPGDDERRIAARSRYEEGNTDALTTTIVSLIAEVEDVPQSEVTSPPLYDVVDVEALERAYSDRGRTGRAAGDVDSTEFSYRGHCVVVRADGSVLIHERVDR